mmetsp:Transcript_30319/g.102296  ORF Transcript_30319/g.102296 Transcript_30319/m.102296 type:complete len:300 (-) Transcript_30319:1546-2445(-)
MAQPRVEAARYQPELAREPRREGTPQSRRDAGGRGLRGNLGAAPPRAGSEAPALVLVALELFLWRAGAAALGVLQLLLLEHEEVLRALLFGVCFAARVQLVLERVAALDDLGLALRDARLLLDGVRLQFVWPQKAGSERVRRASLLGALGPGQLRLPLLQQADARKVVVAQNARRLDGHLRPLRVRLGVRLVHGVVVADVLVVARLHVVVVAGDGLPAVVVLLVGGDVDPVVLAVVGRAIGPELVAFGLNVVVFLGQHAGLVLRQEVRALDLRRRVRGAERRGLEVAVARGSLAPVLGL